MKLTVDRKFEDKEVSDVEVIKAEILSFSDIAILEDGMGLIQCCTEEDKKIRIEYRDEITLVSYRPESTFLPREMVSRLFLSYFQKDGNWKEMVDWVLADFQFTNEEKHALIADYEISKLPQPLLEPLNICLDNDRPEMNIKVDLEKKELEDRCKALEEQLAKLSSAIELKPQAPTSTTLQEEYNPSSWTTSSRGYVNEALICPHCTQKGRVHTKLVSQKVGISGGKATGALFTGGLSMLFTGLSRKEKITEAYCGHCSSTWHF